MSRLITRDFLSATYTGFKSLFNKAYSSAEPLYTRIATITESTEEKETFTLPGGEQEVLNRKYEANIEVDRETYEDDKLSHLRPRIEELGLRAASFPDEMCVKLLNSGFDSVCSDGQHFFDFNHCHTQSNVFSDPFGESALEAAIDRVLSFKDAEGKSLGILPDTLLVGPDNYFSARAVLNKMAAGPLQGVLNLLVSPHVDPGKWFVLATGYPVRPLLFQWRVRPEFTAITDPADEYVFSTDVFKYGVRARCGAGYGLWYMAVGSTGV